MSEVELKRYLITTLHCLLKSKEDIEFQVKRAKEVIKLSCEKDSEDGLGPISIEEDAVWLNYLLRILSEVKSDLEDVKDALYQLGVSDCDLLLSNLENMNNFSKSQGDSALDFSSCKER